MKDLVEPALHGTQNVLSSVAKSKDTVKRVIKTSSFAGKPPVYQHSRKCAGRSTAVAHPGSTDGGGDADVLARLFRINAGLIMCSKRQTSGRPAEWKALH